MQFQLFKRGTSLTGVEIHFCKGKTCSIRKPVKVKGKNTFFCKKKKKCRATDFAQLPGIKHIEVQCQRSVRGNFLKMSPQGGK